MYTGKYCGELSLRKGWHKSTQYLFFKLNTTIYTHTTQRRKEEKKKPGSCTSLAVVPRPPYSNLEKILSEFEIHCPSIRVIPVHVINTLSTQIKGK